jgi:hypothetical protein
MYCLQLQAKGQEMIEAPQEVKDYLRGKVYYEKI